MFYIEYLKSECVRAIYIFVVHVHFNLHSNLVCLKSATHPFQYFVFLARVKVDRTISFNQPGITINHSLNVQNMCWMCILSSSLLYFSIGVYSI